MARRIVLRSDGLYISKPGRDALSGNDDQLISPTLKATRAKVTGSVRNPQNPSVNYTVYHGLGYIPQFFAASNVAGSYNGVSIDENNLYINYVQGGCTVYYIVFYDRWI